MPPIGARNPLTRKESQQGNRYCPGVIAVEQESPHQKETTALSTTNQRASHSKMLSYPTKQRGPELDHWSPFNFNTHRGNNFPTCERTKNW